MDNTVKQVNDAVYNYTTTAVRKTVELQTALFNEFVSLNKSLVELSPFKHFWNTTSNKK
jgi:hypothetical protein